MSSTGVDRITGIDPSVAIKAPCKVISITNITLSGSQTIDSVLVAETTPKTRVVVNGQTNPIFNGIYDVYDTGWKRSTDFNGSRDVVDSTMVTVDSGTVFGDTVWKVSAANPVVIGASAISFVITSSFSNGILLGTTFGALAFTPAVIDRVIRTIRHTSGVTGGGDFIGVAQGSLVPDGGTISISSIAGVYWKRIGFTDWAPAMFGAIGGADATAKIRLAIDACNLAGGGKVVLTDDYLIDGNANPNTFIYGGVVMKPFVTLDLNGHDLTMITSTQANYAIINGFQQTDFKVIGPGNLIGDVVAHAGAVGEFGHGLWLAESKRVVIKDIKVSNCWGDGIYISEETAIDANKAADILIENVISDSNRRQGCSITGGKNITLRTCQLINTGSIKATAPAAGIDIEPQAAGVSAEDIVLDGCIIKNNSLGIVLDTAFANNIRRVEIINCHISGNSQSGYYNDLAGANVKNIKFTNTIIEDGIYGSANTEFTNCTTVKAQGSSSSYAFTETIRTTGVNYNGGEIRSIGNGFRLYFGIAGKTAINRSMFSYVNWVYESGSNGPLTIMVTNSPVDFHSCNFMSDGTIATGTYGFSFTNFGINFGFFTGHNYIESTWQGGVAGVIGDFIMNADHVFTENNSAANTPNIAFCDTYIMNITSAAAIVLNAPINLSNKKMVFVFKNTTGAPSGAITPNAIYKLAGGAIAAVAAGTSTAITMYYNGTNFVECAARAVAIPN